MARTIMSSNPETPARIVGLKTGEEIVGIYKRMETDAFGTTVTLELIGGKTIAVCFVSGSIEQSILRKALRCVKRDINIGILKLNDSKVPLTVQKFYNLRSKKLTLYLDVVTGDRLEKLREPGKPLQTGVTKALDIVDGRETIVAVVNHDKFQCNKMKNMGEANRFYCTMLEALVGKRYCMEKCIVASQLKILNEAR